MPPTATDQMIKIRGPVKNYGERNRGERRQCRSASRRGRRVVWPKRRGKTTTFYMIVGL